MGESYNFSTAADGEAVSNSGAGIAAKDEALAVLVGGTANAVKLGSTEIQYGDGNVTYGIPAADVTAALSNVTLGIGDIVKKQADAASGQISSVLSSLSDLALSKQTDGESVKDNSLTWIILAVCGLLAVVFWRK